MIISCDYKFKAESVPVKIEVWILEGMHNYQGGREDKKHFLHYGYDTGNNKQKGKVIWMEY